MSKLFRLMAFAAALMLVLSACGTTDTLQNLTVVTPEPEILVQDGGEGTDKPITDAAGSIQPTSAPTPEPVKPVSPTTGLDTESIHPITAVALDADAASLLGISKADVVYEFLPEGDTQSVLIALYHDTIPETVSPLGAIYGYAVPYLEAWNPQALYAFGHDATQGEDARAVTRLQNCGIPFKDAAAAQDEAFAYDASAQEMSLSLTAPAETMEDSVSGLDLSPDTEPFSRMAYTITMGERVYRYDEGTGLYSRYLDSADVMDRDGSSVTAMNVVFLRSLYTYSSTNDHCDIALSMGGEADIFTQGSCLYGRWSYDETTGKITLLDENGETVELTPGKTWIHIVPEEAGIDFE